jgi:hypothetical protein
MEGGMKDVFDHLLPSQVVDLMVLAWHFLKGLHEYLKVLVFYLPLFFLGYSKYRERYNPSDFLSGVWDGTLNSESISIECRLIFYRRNRFIEGIIYYKGYRYYKNESDSHKKEEIRGFDRLDVSPGRFLSYPSDVNMPFVKFMILRYDSKWNILKPKKIFKTIFNRDTQLAFQDGQFARCVEKPCLYSYEFEVETRGKAPSMKCEASYHADPNPMDGVRLEGLFSKLN